MNKKIIAGIAVLILIGGGVFYWRGTQSNQEDKDSTTTEKVFVTDTPEPTEEEAVFEKGDFSIKILNGSGTAGLAGSLKTDLEGADFKVEDTGNADSYDYKNTVIQAKADVAEGFIDLLKDELTSKYGTVETEGLDEEEDVDVIVIIGGQQEEEEAEETETETATATDTPTPTPTPTVTDSDTESTPEGELEG